MVKNRTQIWSCGGGVQSVTIGALIVNGELEKPDLAIIVDTEREKSTTWEYYDKYLYPRLSDVGVIIERVNKSKYATVDLFSLKEESVLLPAFTNIKGFGQLKNLCSGEWKREVTKRWARDMGVESCDLWLGMSIDEASKRARMSRLRWIQHKYPLVFDVPMTRNQCFEYLKNNNWPVPKKSSCWCCPQQSNIEWKRQQEGQPHDHKNAVELERLIRTKDENVYLHKSHITLDKIDFNSNEELFTDNELNCDSGYCFI